jgi:hypothetical protein
MDNLLYTAHLPCHMGLPVHGMCFDEKCNGILGCFECLLANHGDHSKRILSIPILVQKADEYYSLMHNVRATEDPPAELKDLLNKEDEGLTSLTLHIDTEKDKLETMILEFQQTFIALTNKIKSKFFQELDSQVNDLQANFKAYRSLYTSFYRGDQVKCVEFPSLADVMKRLNDSTDKKDLEMQLKKLHDDITLRSSLPETLEENILQMKVKVLDFGEKLKKQICSKPSIDTTLKELRAQIDKSFGEITNYFDRSDQNLCSNKVHPIIAIPLVAPPKLPIPKLDIPKIPPIPIIADPKIPDIPKIHDPYFDLPQIDDPYFDLPMIDIPWIDSKILKKDSEKILIQQWLPTEGTYLRLLYRGSRDGYSSSAFHQRCDKSKYTITVVQNYYGKVIGGYSSHKWSGTGGYKESKQAFLFSITDKEKFHVVKNAKKAIYAKKEFGPTFGPGHDLHICNHCNTTRGSYGAINNKCYGPKMRSPEQFGGSQTFLVKEIEVFADEFF